MLRIPVLLVLSCATLGSSPVALAQTYLKASNTGTGDRFGAAVSVSGGTLVVGAWGEDSGAAGVDGDSSDDSAVNSGAAYVFVQSGAGWIEQAYLKASNPDALDTFGFSVSVSGDTLIVGAPGEASASSGVDGDQDDDSAAESGAAYVFVRSGTTWSQQAYLKASNPDAGDGFGFSVSVSGDTLLVGARDEASHATGVGGDQRDDSAELAGAVYVFVRNGTTWSQQAYLKGSNTEAGDEFGYRVSVSGDTAVVGAQWEDSAASGLDGDQEGDGAPQAGAAYVFVRNGTTWSQQAYLKASNTGAGDEFGVWVSLSGDTLVVGANAEDSHATGVDGDQDNDSAASAGAAYVFVRDGTTWSQQAYLKASNADGGDQFGAVAVSGDTIAIGAPTEDSAATGVDGDGHNEGAFNSGAAYVFVRNGTTWSQLAYLKASNTGPGDVFGGAVAVSGDTVVAGAMSEASSATGVDGDPLDNGAPGSGASYVFELAPGPDAWTNLGSGLAGSSGVPLLAGTGPLTAGSANQLGLSGGKPSAAATLIVGLSQLSAPFKGGTLVPAPFLLVPLATNAIGALSLPFLWPAGVPAGIALYFQFWISDAGAVAGFAASNGLKGVAA